MPENLGEVFAPVIICRTCHNDLQKHLNQNRPLRYITPAAWNVPVADHSNCFMCCFTVHKYNRIAKRLFGYASDTSLVLPVVNPSFNDKLNNIDAVKNAKLQELLWNNKEDPEADIAVSQLLNDLIDCVVDCREYANDSQTADDCQPKKINLPIAFNLFKQANCSGLKSQLQSKMNPIYLQSSQTDRLNSASKSMQNGQSTSGQAERSAYSSITNQMTNQMNHQNGSANNPNKRKIDDDDEEDIAIVGEIKRTRDELVSPRPTGSNQLVPVEPRMFHNGESTRADPAASHSSPSKSKPTNESSSSSSTSRTCYNKPDKIHREPVNKRDLTMHHDIEVRRRHVNQVSVADELLTSQEQNLFDLSAGIHQGTFRVEQGIELRTYFGQKYKKNRQVQKTSRNEFDDLISMLDISESSAQVLETFFERKNYFVWF